MADIDKFRLDIDEAMAAAQVDRAADTERRLVMSTWQGIQHELDRGKGPFARMLWAFRQDAKEALQKLVYADANDSKTIAQLQAAVQRCLDTMEHIDDFRTGAEAAAANDEQDLLSEDDTSTTISRIEDDE